MDWKLWCRLCGNHNTLSKVDPEVEDIIKILSSHITNASKICLECNNFLTDINQFLQKSKIIQNMFLELESTDLIIQNLSDIEYNYEKSINDIRNRFGLKQLDDYNDEEKDQEILDSLFDDSALEIKIENEIDHLPIVDDSNALLDDDNVSETTTDEDEAINFNENESSDDEDDEEEEEEELSEHSSSKLRKKCRKEKSDEEKLFDFVCHVCKQEFDKMSLLTNHCRKIHNCLPQVICFCGKTLGTWKRLLIHKQKHFPEKFDYECKECKMVYKMKASYLNHMKHKHGPDSKKFVCSKCARCFKDTRTLTAHEKTHLPDELKLIYPCDICHKKFVNKNSLKSHITSVHEMANLYTCEQCGKSFSTKSNLKSHLYSHSNEKNVQCEMCSAKFKNMDSLRKHKKTHLEKSHECNICGNRYRNRNNLKAHMVCHSEAKPFKCTYCQNEYKRSKDLKCHMNLHTGERPYQCQFCSRTFVNGSNCRKHKLKDHADELAAFEAVHGRGKAAVFALQSIKQDDKS